MLEASAPIANVRKSFVFEIHPNLFSLFKCNNTTSRDRHWNVHHDPNLNKISSLFDWTFWISYHLAKDFTNFFCCRHVYVSYGHVMHLDPKGSLLKLETVSGVSFTYRCIIIKCLLKLQGSLMRTRSMSALSSKMKRTMWSPWFYILKPFLVRHSGLKVCAMASMFSARFVRNFSAMMYSWDLSSLVRQHPGPSFSDKERRFQLVVRSSMVEWEMIMKEE